MALKTYDMICIFPTSLSEEALGDVLTRIDDEIGKLGGQVVSKQPMGERMFARQMKKRDAGIYMTLRCELDPTSVDTLRARLKLVDDLFRSQILVAEPETEEAEEAEEAVAAEAPVEEVVVDG
ncbi:MAG: 30S ribosomal protein S6 [Kiritimatiellae bacterium]|nr:30S ribosomal protein S6 [Kiritimatiellia bacterium]